MKKSPPKHNSNSKKFKRPAIITLFLVITCLAGLLWYKTNLVVPSINLADGLDAEEAAFLQKSISKDKVKSVGTAPAPVVKVTVKKKNGDEVTGKVVLQNINPTTDVTTLTNSITSTVTTNNTPTKLGISSSPTAELGLSCDTIGDNQWAQTGIRFQDDGSTPCVTNGQCSDKKECVQCVGGKLDLSSKQVCGVGSAINYVITTAEKDKLTSCWNKGLWYANDTNLASVGFCQNGNWESSPATTVTPVIIDTRIEQAELDKQKQQELTNKLQAEAKKNAERLKSPYSKQGCDNAKKEGEKCVQSADNSLLYMIVSIDFDESNIQIKSNVTPTTTTSQVQTSISPGEALTPAPTLTSTIRAPITYEYEQVAIDSPDKLSNSESDTPTNDEGVGLVYLNQNDYADVSIPGGGTWSSAGCGIMAGAMVFSLINGEADPYAYNRLLDQHTAVSSGGTGWFTHKEILEENGFDVVPVYGSLRDKEDQILKYAENGIPVWINAYIDNGSGTYIGHHTLAIGVDDSGNLILDDPFYGENYHLPISRIDLDCSKSGFINSDGEYECKNGSQNWFVNAIIPPEV